MSVLEGITQFEVPMKVVDQTLVPLQDAGRSGYEAFVLWGGRRAEDTSKLVIEASYFPRQTTMATEDGLLVVVEGEALFRVNRAFHEQGLILAAQVHSHPTEAFHSSTDDAYPLVTLLGGLSGVVPNFARDGREGLGEWVWYRLAGPGKWAELNEQTTIEFIQ